MPGRRALEVAAPGWRSGQDARDAAHLARLLRLGEITEVRVPEREIEAVRDLVRARRGTRLFSPTAATRKPSAHHS
jgi:hypothetical protein